MLNESEAFRLMAEHARSLAGLAVPDLADRLREWADECDALDDERVEPAERTASNGARLQLVSRGTRERAPDVAWEDQPHIVARRVWKSVTREERDRLVLDALGDDRLTVGETVERVDHVIPEARVYYTGVLHILRRLMQDGLVEREQETFQNKPRWRYARSKPLSGPIADLDREFGND